MESQIRTLLGSQPGLKSAQIAKALGVDRTIVNRILHGALKNDVRQDRSYRWFLAEEGSMGPVASDEEPLRTNLSRICRYYLACLGYDDTGVSIFLNSKYGDPDYVEIEHLPRSSEDFADLAPARKLMGRLRTERGRYGLYFGYPTNIPLIHSRKSSWQGFMVEPLLLFPIEQDASTGKLQVDLGFPIINQKPFRRFTNVESDMVMGEISQLEQELGIGDSDTTVDLDEIAMRLQSIRGEWPWAEAIDPSNLSHEQSIASITKPGIYNRAVVLMAEKSPFTLGLENELSSLAKLPEDRFANTAVGAWIAPADSIEEPSSSLGPLLEVLPMNTEQRQAVRSALSKPLTVITGPPGTGKSQVVMNLLINAAWYGKQILFASKNNKAVDVVETRVNAIGSRPTLVRVGSTVYQRRLAEYVLDMLAVSTTSAEQQEFDEVRQIHTQLEGRFRALGEEAASFVTRRNRVDELERSAEDARRLLGEALFAQAEKLSVGPIDSALNLLRIALRRADRSASSFFEQIVWPLLRDRRLREIEDQLNEAAPHLQAIDVEPYRGVVAENRLGELDGLLATAEQRLEAIGCAQEYLGHLRALQKARSLEEVALEEARLTKEIAKNSERLWKLWLRVQPSSLPASDRQKLGRYKSLLSMVMDSGDQGQLTKDVFKQYSTMVREISHLLPCWAVTSLSARGRVPFEPGVFDIVVIDEASQCDIASALPLLYRAKSVVIIGDPKQLSHITTLPRAQDQALLDRFGLLSKYPHWSYTHQTLFSLAATCAAGDSIISLVDHHRSHADIIEFANEEFYQDRLRVATRYERLHRPSAAESGVRWIDVKGSVSRPGGGGAVNPVEARAVIGALGELVVTRGYTGSIGVVTPFRAQVAAITHALHEDEQLSRALLEHDFLVDTVHKFQGDERDVMVFSPVVSERMPERALGFLRSNGNLFNVAITRARAQLIVVGDQQACRASDIGYLSRFAEYATQLAERSQERLEALATDLGPAYPVVANPALVSDWEKSFYVSAYKAGIRLIPQYAIEKYIVDFLLISGDRKLTVEIDGERYHKNWTGELCRRDQLRNQRLYELGYDVMRFWVYEVRDDLHGCLARLQAWITS